MTQQHYDLLQAEPQSARHKRSQSGQTFISGWTDRVRRSEVIDKDWSLAEKDI